jgi:O-antigen/teichoic acid export membrane protein
MIKKYKKVFLSYSKEASWIIFGQFFGILITLASLRILTELISPLEYGKLTLSLTIITMANQLLFGPLNNGIIRFSPVSIEKKEPNFFFKSVYHLFIKTIAILFILTSILYFILFYIGYTQYYFTLFLCFIISIIYGADSLLNGILNVLRLRKVASLFNFLSIFFKFICAIIFTSFFTPITTIILISYGFATILIVIAQIYFTKTVLLSYDNKIQPINNWNVKIVDYSLPFVIWGVFTWIHGSSDKWVLSIYDSDVSVGLYSTVLQLGNGPVSLVSGFLIQFFTPIFFTKAGDASDKNRNIEVFNLNKRLIIFTLISTILLFFATLFTHKNIFLLFVSNKFASVSYLLPYVVLNSGLFAVGQNISMNFLSSNNTKILLYIKISTSILGITLNILGVYYLKLNGLVLASFIFSITYCLLLIFYSNKIHERFKE